MEEQDDIKEREASTNAGEVYIAAAVEEEEEPIEVLDAVSTAATRASSIAGSVLGEPLPPSALGEVSDDAKKSEESCIPVLDDPSASTLTTFAFAEPTGAATDSDDEQARFHSIQDHLISIMLFKY